MSEAATVAEAMDCLAARTPAWILLDLMLPDGCGSEVLRKVRAQRLPSKTCVITGCGDAMIAHACRDRPEHTFIKPLDVEQLVTVMTEVETERVET